MLSVALLVALISDQVSKAIVEQQMVYLERVDLIGSLLGLRYVHNTGIGFGLLRGLDPFLIAGIQLMIIGVVLLAVFRFRYQITIAEEFFVGMIIGGAFGNLVDRLRLGYVVDFIELPFWPIFNAADSFLVVGAVLLLITYYRRERRAHRAHSI